jgi:hypothetical protein
LDSVKSLKIYHGIRKRVAKKYLGYSWYKINNYGRFLRAGDLISTCKGWNEPIAEITPEWRPTYGLRGHVVIDFHIFTESGGSHSLTHCCSFPLETKQEIIKYWLDHDNDWYKAWYSQSQPYEESLTCRMISGIKAGEDVFMEDGQINEKWLRGNE